MSSKKAKKHSNPVWSLQRETQYRWTHEGPDGGWDSYEFSIEGTPSSVYRGRKEWSLCVTRHNRTLTFDIFWSARSAKQYAKDHLQEIITAFRSMERAEQRCMKRFFELEHETGIHVEIR